MPSHRIVQAEGLPKPAGPYSPATSLQHVLRCGVFLIDMGEFSRMSGL